MEPAHPHTGARYCPNCHYPMRKDAPFCSECGQKYTTGRVTVWQLLREFLGSLLNVDSQFFGTLRAILSPGKLTVEYFKGRQKRYVHPARFFLFTALVHFAILGIVLVDGKENLNEILEERKRSLHRDAFLLQLDSVKAGVDSLFSQKIAGQALDTLRRRMGENVTPDSTTVFYFDPTAKKFIEKSISSQDVFDQRLSELLDNYGIKGTLPRFQAGQFLRIIKEGSNFIGFMLGNLIWLVALMMPALALLLKLLYIRRKKYFVEHLVFSFHYHAFAFLAFSVAILANLNSFKFEEHDGDLNRTFTAEGAISLAFFIVMGYLFIAMRRVYGQGYFKTFVKFGILNFSYLFIFLVSLVLTLVIGALLF